MKFFSKKNIYSDVNVHEKYISYIDTLDLGPSIILFINTINLHDGIIFSIDTDVKSNNIQLGVNIGDLLCGYKNLFITYYDAYWYRAIDTTKDLKEEILYDEFDINNNMYSHAFIFSHYDYREIHFRRLEFSLTPVSERINIWDV